MQVKLETQKIAIFGASGQVGSSVAFYFKKYTPLEPICFIRSSYSKVFFDILNIKSEIIDINDPVLKEKLKNINWVLDFTFPTGQTSELPQKIKNNIKTITSSMTRNSKYIYMSSIMAYGMPDQAKYVKSYIFPRVTYGSIKRQAERITRKFGKKYSIQTYIFRLGQVHGFLQSVNASFRLKLKQSNKIYVDARDSDLTNTIFISSVCNAIIKCVENEIKPGLYTLVSNPQWTIRELYDYYKSNYALGNEFIFAPRRKTASLLISLVNWLRFKLKKARPFIETYLLIKLPSLSAKIKGKYRELETKNQINRVTYTYSDFHLLGKPSSSMIKMIESEIPQVLKKEKEMEEFYNSIINNKENVS